MIKIVPLPTTSFTDVLVPVSKTMLWHLHANNIGSVPVTVEIHLGDNSLGSIKTLLAVLALEPYGTASAPLSLTDISLDAGVKISAKASIGAAANVVLNWEERT